MGLLISKYSANPVTNNSIQINAVSGTMSKTFKNSYFIRFHQNSKVAERLFGRRSYRIEGDNYNGRPVEVVVLQTMLCGDGEFLSEVIDKDDYCDMYNDGQSKKED